MPGNKEKNGQKTDTAISQEEFDAIEDAEMERFMNLTEEDQDKELAEKTGKTPEQVRKESEEMGLRLADSFSNFIKIGTPEGNA